MWVQVTQKIESLQDPGIKNWVNSDMVERVHACGNGSTLHLQSGEMIDIKEEVDWWKEQVFKQAAIQELFK